MAYNFNVQDTYKACLQWIRDWFSKELNEDTMAVIGISGGKDSALTAKLLVDALGKERVFGVLLPNGEQKDISDSQKVCSFLGIRNITINIKKSYEGLTEEIENFFNSATSNYSNYKSNTPARLRMTSLYGIAAVLGNAVVANTCNLSEDVMGYSTFYGDSAGSFAPLSKLTTEEVVAMGDYAGLPKEIVHKAPSDGMCGKTDEDNMGWTYHEVNQVIRENKKGPNYEKIIERWKKNKFKIEIIQLPHYDPELPVCIEGYEL
ncbi:MAG: NAD(+) synthase [Treponema sp.]|nr:NAD(+) synthase [Treponema sp.]